MPVLTAHESFTSIQNWEGNLGNPEQRNVHSLWSTRDFHTTALRPPLFFTCPKNPGVWLLPGSVPGHHDAHTGQTLQLEPGSLPAVWELSWGGITSGRGLTSPLSYLQTTCVAAATRSFSASALPQHLALSSFKGKEKPQCNKGENPSLRTRGVITKPSWPPQSTGL